MKTISSQDFFKQRDLSHDVILDVRGSDEFVMSHLPQSINIPLEKVEQGAVDIPHDKKIYLLCQTGTRAARARDILVSRGYSHVVCVEGGMNECAQIPGKVVVLSKVMPLMRQVQVAAGTLILIGLGLSHWVSKEFILITLFVGVGLVFAGLTGYCGMAVLLSKMPWNKFPVSTLSASSLQCSVEATPKKSPLEKQKCGGEA